jgi:hypothetical protein
MLLFFFIYLFVFLLFCKDDYFDNFFEFSLIDFRKDLDEFDDEWYFSFNEASYFYDQEVDDYMIEYEWELEFMAFDDDDDDSFNVIEDTYDEEEITEMHEYNSEFFDNLYFFERWLNLSYEILDRIEFKRKLRYIQNKELKNTINLFFNSHNYYAEINNEFLNLFNLFLNNFNYANKLNKQYLYVNNLVQLSKLFLITNNILHDDVSFLIKYFRIKSISLQFRRDREKNPRFKYWGQTSDITALKLIKYKKFFNYNFIRPLNIEKQLNFRSQVFFNLFSKKLYLGFHQFFFLGFMKNFTIEENKLVNNFYKKNTKKNLFLVTESAAFLNKTLVFLIDNNKFNCSLFYINYLNYLLLTFPDVILLTEEEREYLTFNFFINKKNLFLEKFPSDFLDEFLKTIIERHFRSTLQIFFKKIDQDNIIISLNENKFNFYIKKYFINFYNLFFKEFSTDKFLNQLYQKYRIILYKILAKGWKNTKINSKQIRIFLALNDFHRNFNLTSNFFIPYKKITLSSKFKSSLNIDYFSFIFFPLKLGSYNIAKRFIARKSFVDEYTYAFYYEDPLTSQFFFRQKLKKRRKKNFFFTLKSIYHIKSLKYFFFYFLPKLFNFNKYNLRYLASNKLFNRFYKYFFKWVKSNKKITESDLPNDLFFFPFLFPLLKKSNEKNIFLTQIQDQLETIFQHDVIAQKIVLNKYVLKLVNLTNQIKFSVDFFFILDLLNIYLFSNFKNQKSFSSFVYTYNILVYKKSFLLNYLRPIPIKLKIKNLTNFKFTLSFYFYKFFSKNHNFKSFIFRLNQDLNKHDFEVLNSLFNKYWSMGFDGAVNDDYEYGYDLVNEEGYFVIDLGDGPTFISDSLSVFKDFYATKWLEFKSILYYIDMWLKKIVIDDEDEAEDEDYIIFWAFLFFFWLFCRWIRFFNRSNSHIAAKRIDTVMHFEAYTDAYKSWFLEMIAPGSNVFLGKNYVGTIRGRKDHTHPWRFIQQAFMRPPIFIYGNLPKELMPSENEFGKNKMKQFAHSYKLTEYRFLLDDANFVINDFFRYGTNRRNLTKYKLKWLLYGNLRSSLNLNSHKKEYIQTIFGNTFNEHYKINRGDRNFGDISRAEYILRDPLTASHDNTRLLTNIIYNDAYRRQLKFNLDLNYLSLKYFFFFNKRIDPYFIDDRFAIKTKELEELKKKKKKLPYWGFNWMPWDHYSFEAYQRYAQALLIEEKFYNFSDVNNILKTAPMISGEKEHFFTYKKMVAKVGLPTLEREFIKLENKSDVYLRPVYRYLIYLSQGFFTQTVFGQKNSSKHAYKIDDLRYNLVLQNLNRNIIGSIIRNVAQYRSFLRKRYSDTIYYLPIYLNFLSNLSEYQYENLIKLNPEIFYLIFKYISVFKEEPFLNSFLINLETNRSNFDSNWYRYMYHNPWFIKNYTKRAVPRRRLVSRWLTRGLDAKLQEAKENKLPEGVLRTNSQNWFFNNIWWNIFIPRMSRELERMLIIAYEDTDNAFNYYNDIDISEIGTYAGGNSFKTHESYLKNLYQVYDRVMTPTEYKYQYFYIAGATRYQKIISYGWLGSRSSWYNKVLFDSLSPHSIYDVKRTSSLHSAFASRFVKHNSLKSHDHALDYGIPEVYNKLPLGFFYAAHSTGYTPTIPLIYPVRNGELFYFPKTYGKKFFKLLKHYRLAPRTLIETRHKRKTFPREYTYKNKIYETPLKPEFRKFRKTNYTRLKDEFLFNSARQLVEQYYAHSDSLFESKANYLHGPYMFQGLELHAAEPNLTRQWYEPHMAAKMEFERYASAYTDIAIWPWLTRMIYQFPAGTPPLLLIDMHGVPEKTDYINKYNRYFYPERYRNPIHMDDALEGNFFFQEEGTLSRFWFYPISTFIYDVLASFVKQILFFFDKTNFFFYLQSYNGIGDLYNRPLAFRDGFLNSYDTNIANLERYKKKYIKVEPVANQSEIHKIFLSMNMSSKYFYYFNTINFKIIILLNKMIDYFKVNFIEKYRFKYQSFILWTNSQLFGMRYAIFLFILIWFLLYYFVWVPMLYFISILRNWVDYPNEPDTTGQTEDDDDENPLEEYQGPTVFVEDGYKYVEPYIDEEEDRLEDSGIKFGTYGQDISFDVVEFFLNLYGPQTFYADVDLLSGLNFTTMTVNNFHLYLDSSSTLIKNEILDLYNIQLPGNKFVYNLIDIYSLVNAEFFLNYQTAPLPQYRVHFQEFLHLLTGYGRTLYDIDQEFYFNRDEQFNFFFDQKLPLYRDMRSREVFKYDNIVEQKYHKEGLERNPNFTYTDFTTGIYFDTRAISKNGFPITVWYSNKTFIDGLNLFNYASKFIINNNLFNQFLFNENKNICLNLLDFNFDFNSWINFSKFNFYNLQYKLGEAQLPFYLRFLRSDYTLKELSYLNEPLSRNLKILSTSAQLDFKSDSFDIVNIHDLFMVQPENHEGLLNSKIALDLLLDIRNYFESRLLEENGDHMDEIYLDLHTLEIDKWYSEELLEIFNEDYVDFFDWLRVIEDSKEWVIYLDETQFIKLTPDYKFKTYYNDEFVTRDISFLNYLRYDDFAWHLFYLYRRHRHIKNKLAYTSKQHIVPTEMDGRYFEEPQFPEPELYFSDSLLNHTSRQNFLLKSVLFNLITRKKSTLISSEIFCHAISLQYINLEVVLDINKILSPTHRSVNKRLSIESTLQLYSYFNYFLIENRNMEILKFFTKSLISNKSIIKPLKNKPLKNNYFFIIYFILFVNLIYLYAIFL